MLTFVTSCLNDHTPGLMCSNTHRLSHFPLVLITGENLSPAPTVPLSLPAAGCSSGLSRGPGCHHTLLVFLLLPQASRWPDRTFFLNCGKIDIPFTIIKHTVQRHDACSWGCATITPALLSPIFPLLVLKSTPFSLTTETSQSICKFSPLLYHPLHSVFVRDGRVVPLSVLLPSEKGQISQSLCFCRVRGTAAVCTDGVPHLLWSAGPVPGPNRVLVMPHPCAAGRKTGPPEA